MARELTYQITEEQEGMRVGDFLRRGYGYSGRVIKQIKEDVSSIDLDGRHIRMVDPLHAGDLLRIRLPEQTVEILPSDLAVPVLYEDEDMLLFDKPPGMACHPTRKHWRDTLANVYAARFSAGECPPFRPVNRLDRDTSGIVVAAKNEYTASRLGTRVEKEYLALCHGRLPEAFGTLDFPIGRVSEDEVARYATPLGQRAVTHYQVLQRFNNYTFLRLVLDTGRTHQIRVHLASIGNPLAGDSLYGGTQELIDRQALHCAQVTWIHPVTGERHTVRSPLCKELKNALEKAEIGLYMHKDKE